MGTVPLSPTRRARSRTSPGHSAISCRSPLSRNTPTDWNGVRAACLVLPVRSMQPGQIQRNIRRSIHSRAPSADGLVSDDGVRVGAVPGADTGGVTRLYPTSSGLLLAAEQGLFLFDGAKTARLEGDSVGHVRSIQELSGGPLIVGESGLYRLEGNPPQSHE